MLHWTFIRNHSQPWLHIRITWEALKNPDAQAILQTKWDFSERGVVGTCIFYFACKALQVILKYRWVREPGPEKDDFTVSVPQEFKVNLSSNCLSLKMDKGLNLTPYACTFTSSFIQSFKTCPECLQCPTAQALPDPPPFSLEKLVD